MPITNKQLKTLLDTTIKKCDEAEFYLIEKQSLKIDVINQKLESLDEIKEAGLAVRVIKNNKLGFSYTADFEESYIEDTINQAIETAVASSADDSISFAEPKTQKINIDLIDPAIAKTPVEDKIKLALEIEKEAYSYDKRVKKSEKVSYQDSIIKTSLLNSKGLDISYIKTGCGAFAEVIAEENGLMETGSWIKFTTKYNEIDPKIIGTEAGKRAVSMLGAKPVSGGRAPIIFSPYVASLLISTLCPALTAESAQKGKSLFASAVGKPVASRIFSLIDSGVLKDGVESVPYDDEGSPTEETIIIKDGVYKGFLNNCQSAKRSGTTPTGNALRASFKAQPDIIPTNLYVVPGTNHQSELIDGISKGFLVESIMGAHTINPISGFFSIGFSGFLIENGKVTRPVRGMTIAGNFIDLLTRIEAIGNDTGFFPHMGSIGSPSILISNLSVSGI